MADEKKFIVRDGGDHTNFETGSKRSSAKGKGRFDLVPAYPIRRLAQHYEKGSAVYGDRNWEKGQPLMRYICSAESHLSDLKAGDQVEDHCAAIMWNICGYIHTLNEIEHGRLPASLDDRPDRMKPPTLLTASTPPAVCAPELVHGAPATVGETPVEKKFLGEEMRVETVGGHPVHVTAWLRGGCCGCGNHERGGLTYGHDRCWDRLGSYWSAVAQLLDEAKKVENF